MDIISALFLFSEWKSSSYNATVFDNRSSFTGEEIQYTTFANWIHTITDQLHVTEMEEKYDCSETELKLHIKTRI